MKKKMVPVLAVLILIFIILVGIIAGRKIKQYLPSNEEQDLNVYFGVASQDEAAIELNHNIIEEKALLVDSVVYLDFNFVHDQLNDRFYWDANENVLLYTMSSNVVKASADSMNYYVGRKKENKPYKIVLVNKDQTYIALDYVAEYTNITISGHGKGKYKFKKMRLTKARCKNS